MKRDIRQCPVLFWVLAIVLIGTIGMAHAQKPDGVAEDKTELTGPPSVPTPVDPLRPIQTDRIDKAGQKVSKSIEKIGQTASSHLGTWINHKLVAGISWLKLFACLLMLIAVVIAERVLRIVLERKISTIPSVEGKISWTRMLLQAVRQPVGLFIWVYGAYAAFSPLYEHFQSPGGSNILLSIVKRTADIGGTIALFWFLYRLVSLLDARLKRWASTSENTIDDMLAPLLGKTLRLFIIIIGAMMVLQNLSGIKIGPLIASLGIGGLAIAFAAKDSIANFFGTLTILFDKPFQVGDRIVIDTHDGMVENVGFRSTRIRTLTGNQVSIPNEKVVNTALENIGRRPNLRWLNQIGIPYDTPVPKVEEAVAILRSILENHEGMREDLPPRVHFNGFNDWSLNITVVAWYHPPNWWDYQEWVQKTCLDIMRRFGVAGIEFAFPSQTLYLANDNKRLLRLTVPQAAATQGQEP